MAARGVQVDEPDLAADGGLRDHLMLQAIGERGLPSAAFGQLFLPGGRVAAKVGGGFVHLVPEKPAAISRGDRT